MSTVEATKERPDEAQKYTARVSRGGDDEPLGAPLFLGVDDLEAVGIDLDGVHHVDYWIEDGAVQVAPSREEAPDA